MSETNQVTPERQIEIDELVSKIKGHRRTIQLIHDGISKLEGSRANALAITKLDEASMWLGKRLQELQVANPYPTSRDPSIKAIDPPAPEACHLPS